jgi:glycosidase
MKIKSIEISQMSINMKKYFKYCGVSVLVFMTTTSCKYVTYSEDRAAKKYVIKTNVVHPDWAESAVIYKVNLSKYTPEGTIKAFEEHLPRLHGMGVEILLLSPIFPVKSQNMDESNSSPYSVRDYLTVDPHLGTKDDLEDLIKEAHAIDMYVILDWQPESITSDNPLAIAHPMWCKKDSKENQISSADTLSESKLNFEIPEVRQYMSDAMKYWVEDFDIDGYHCENAGNVSCDFWTAIRSELEDLKPVLMIAEDEGHPCLVENGFDMNYEHKLSILLNGVFNGDFKLKELKSYFTKADSTYDPEIYRMNFTDESIRSSTKQSGKEKIEKASEALTLLTFTVPGMPLINEGQSGGADMQLDSLREGTLNWAIDKRTKIYKSFIKLKKSHVVFWNGSAGGNFEIIDIKSEKHVFAFLRQSDDENAIVIFNLSGKPVKFRLKGKNLEGNYFNYFSSLAFEIADQIEMEPYGYLVLLDEF